jgi:hypothetical protein
MSPKQQQQQLPSKENETTSINHMFLHGNDKRSSIGAYTNHITIKRYN